MAGYLSIGDIKGESKDSGHEEWIDIQSISQGLVRPIQPGASGQQRYKTSVSCGDIVCVKDMDASTPKLIEAVCDGTVFPEVKIDVTTSVGEGKRKPYYQWVLKNVIVSSYDISGDPSSDFSESISLNYEEITWTYDKTGKDGKSKGKVEASWKTEEGTK